MFCRVDMDIKILQNNANSYNIQLLHLNCKLQIYSKID